MTVALSQEDKEVMNDLYQSVVSFKQNIIELSLFVLIELKKYIWNFIVSLGEFSPDELRKHGLEEILMRRALRFFGLGSEEDKRSDKRTDQKLKPTFSVKFKKAISVLLLPVYLVIIICLGLRRKQRRKYVKNNYKT